jgi:Zn-dependent peptidase ImmA (M78 family)
MSIKFVKWHKRKTLEQVADEVHKRFTCQVPIDIDYITEMMGLEILDISRLKEDFGLYGFLGQVKKKFVIFVQKGDFKLTNYYTNFTIAEELSHFILHKEYFKNVKDFNEAFDFYTKIAQQSEMMIELNAKYLAGAILLPREHLKKKATEAYKQNESVFNEILKKGNEESCEAIIAGISSSLIDIYRVPEGPIAFRLKTAAIGFKEFIISKFKEKCN